MKVRNKMIGSSKIGSKKIFHKDPTAKNVELQAEEKFESEAHLGKPDNWDVQF